MDERAEQPGEELTLTLNGKQRSVRSGTHVLDLLVELELRERLVVVERNGEIVPRAAYAETLLGDGDILEIVHFVGGGGV